MQLKDVGGKGDSLLSPVSKTEENADAEPPESRCMGSLRSIQPPVIILLRACRVKFTVGLPVIGLLLDYQPLGTSRHERQILLSLHRGDFE